MRISRTVYVLRKAAFIGVQEVQTSEMEEYLVPSNINWIPIMWIGGCQNNYKGYDAPGWPPPPTVPTPPSSLRWQIRDYPRNWPPPRRQPQFTDKVTVLVLEFKFRGWTFDPTEPSGDQVVIRRTEPTDLEPFFATNGIVQQLPTCKEGFKLFIRTTSGPSRLVGIFLNAVVLLNSKPVKVNGKKIRTQLLKEGRSLWNKIRRHPKKEEVTRKFLIWVC